MRLGRARCAVGVVLLAGILAGCDGESPSAPSGGGPGGGGPGGNARLTVEGPTDMSVGDVSVFRVTQETAGETRDVTSSVRWTIAPPFLTFAGGTATAVGTGAASITAEVDGVRSAPRAVRIGGGLEGAYTMTIGSGVCKWGNLPLEFRNRTFRATITQQGTGLALQLGGAAFQDHLSGTGPVVSGQYVGGADPVVFELPPAARGWWNEYEAVWSPVTEVLPDGSRIEIFGTVRATVTPDGLSGTFKGFFDYSPSPSALYKLNQDCESEHHQFRMVK